MKEKKRHLSNVYTGISVSHWPLFYSDAKQRLTFVLKPMLAIVQWCKVCCINNPCNKHLSQTVCIIYLSIRELKKLWGIACCILENRVCECEARQGGHWHGAAVFGQRGPLCVPSTLEQEPRRSGLCFNSNKLLQHFRDDIWRYQHAKPGRGWPIALLTRPWELPLPRLCRGDLCHCRVLKYHSSAPSSSSCLFFHSPPDWLNETPSSLTSYYPFLSYTG